MTIIDELVFEYESLKDLNYYDPKIEYIDLYRKGDFVGYIEVWTDRENEEREYIIINNELVYLDTIECIN